MIELLLAESPAPEFDAAWALTIVARVLHTVAGAILLGGIIYLKQVVAPVAVDAEDTDQALYRGRRGSWSLLVMIATAFLLFSGFYNLYNIIVTSDDLPGTYHMIFGIKFLIAMFVFFVAAATAGQSPLAMKMRSSIRWWLNVCLVALVAVYLLGAVLRSFEKFPRPVDNGPAAQLLHSPAIDDHG